MKFSSWIYASRLRTLPLAFSSILFGATAALIAGAAISPITFSLCLLTTLLLQVLSNLANDYGDAQKGTDNEKRIGPSRAIQSGMLTAKEVKAGLVVVAAMCLVAGVALLFSAFQTINPLFLVFLLLGLAAIAAAIKYTVGKNAYGYKGMGDLFVFLFFGLVGVCGSAFLFSGIFKWHFLLPATLSGCMATAVLNLNNMRDVENDAASGKRTLVVLMGSRNAVVYHYTLLSVAAISASLYIMLFFQSKILIAPVIFLLGFLTLRVVKTTIPSAFDNQLKPTAMAAFLLSILFIMAAYWQ
jgi:1,4-dihydroxy-2-naphthoate octaprenyltransferase